MALIKEKCFFIHLRDSINKHRCVIEKENESICSVLKVPSEESTQKKDVQIFREKRIFGI